MVRDIPLENNQLEHTSGNIKKENSILKRIKSFTSNINHEDLFLILLLFLLIEESVEDEFLILMLIVIIMTEKD